MLLSGNVFQWPFSCKVIMLGTARSVQTMFFITHVYVITLDARGTARSGDILQKYKTQLVGKTKIQCGSYFISMHSKNECLKQQFLMMISDSL